MAPVRFVRFVIPAMCIAIFLFGGSASAQTRARVRRFQAPKSNFPISQGVWVPAGYDTLYLSGTSAPAAERKIQKDGAEVNADTQAQTVSTIKNIQKILAAQKLSLGDIVMMHVYLAGDPEKNGKMDFSGFMAGYSQFFGTPKQPNKPARSTFQVAALAGQGTLVEIEVIAVRPRSLLD